MSSSWFGSFFRRNSTIPEEEDGQQPSTSSSASQEPFTEEGDPNTIATATVPALSAEQRQHIREVMQRAERSNQAAKIVMDSRRLRNVNTSPLRDRKRIRISSRQKLNDFAGDESPSIASATGDEEDEMDIVQMESLPENMEITIGPSCSSYVSSYASSEMGSVSDRDDLLEREDTMPIMMLANNETTDLPENFVTDEQPMTEHQPINIARSMQLLSQKIAQWIKSLDEEDDYVTPTSALAGKLIQDQLNSPIKEETVQHGVDNIATDETNILSTAEIEKLAALFYPGSPLNDYCAYLAMNICILAMADSLFTEEEVTEPLKAEQEVSNIFDWADAGARAQIYTWMPTLHERDENEDDDEDTLEEMARWLADLALEAVYTERELLIRRLIREYCENLVMQWIAVVFDEISITYRKMEVEDIAEAGTSINYTTLVEEPIVSDQRRHSSGISQYKGAVPVSKEETTEDWIGESQFDITETEKELMQETAEQVFGDVITLPDNNDQQNTSKFGVMSNSSSYSSPPTSEADSSIETEGPSNNDSSFETEKVETEENEPKIPEDVLNLSGGNPERRLIEETCEEPDEVVPTISAIETSEDSQPTVFEFSPEELEHIERIRKMAEQDESLAVVQRHNTARVFDTNMDPNATPELDEYKVGNSQPISERTSSADSSVSVEEHMSPLEESSFEIVNEEEIANQSAESENPLQISVDPSDYEHVKIGMSRSASSSTTSSADSTQTEECETPQELAEFNEALDETQPIPTDSTSENLAKKEVEDPRQVRPRFCRIPTITLWTEDHYEISQEELEHIERVKEMAAQSSAESSVDSHDGPEIQEIITPGIASSSSDTTLETVIEVAPKSEQAFNDIKETEKTEDEEHSSATSSADSEGPDSPFDYATKPGLDEQIATETYENTFETNSVSEKLIEAPQTDELNLSQEEIFHILRVADMAESENQNVMVVDGRVVHTPVIGTARGDGDQNTEENSRSISPPTSEADTNEDELVETIDISSFTNEGISEYQEIRECAEKSTNINDAENVTGEQSLPKMEVVGEKPQPKPPRPPPPPARLLRRIPTITLWTEDNFEITQDELEHIEKVKEMARRQTLEADEEEPTNLETKGEEKEETILERIDMVEQVEVENSTSKDSAAIQTDTSNTENDVYVAQQKKPARPPPPTKQTTLSFTEEEKAGSQLIPNQSVEELVDSWSVDEYPEDSSYGKSEGHIVIDRVGSPILERDDFIESPLIGESEENLENYEVDSRFAGLTSNEIRHIEWVKKLARTDTEMSIFGDVIPQNYPQTSTGMDKIEELEMDLEDIDKNRQDLVATNHNESWDSGATSSADSSPTAPDSSFEDYGHYEKFLSLNTQEENFPEDKALREEDPGLIQEELGHMSRVAGLSEVDAQNVVSAFNMREAPTTSNVIDIKVEYIHRHSESTASSSPTSGADQEFITDNSAQENTTKADKEENDLNEISPTTSGADSEVQTPETYGNEIQISTEGNKGFVYDRSSPLLPEHEADLVDSWPLNENPVYEYQSTLTEEEWAHIEAVKQLTSELYKAQITEGIKQSATIDVSQKDDQKCGIQESEIQERPAEKEPVRKMSQLEWLQQLAEESAFETKHPIDEDAEEEMEESWGVDLGKRDFIDEIEQTFEPTSFTATPLASKKFDLNKEAVDIAPSSVTVSDRNIKGSSKGDEASQFMKQNLRSLQEDTETSHAQEVEYVREESSSMENDILKRTTRPPGPLRMPTIVFSQDWDDSELSPTELARIERIKALAEHSPVPSVESEDEQQLVDLFGKNAGVSQDRVMGLARLEEEDDRSSTTTSGADQEEITSSFDSHSSIRTTGEVTVNDEDLNFKNQIMAVNQPQTSALREMTIINTFTDINDTIQAKESENILEENKPSSTSGAEQKMYSFDQFSSEVAKKQEGYVKLPPPVRPPPPKRQTTLEESFGVEKIEEQQMEISAQNEITNEPEANSSECSENESVIITSSPEVEQKDFGRLIGIDTTSPLLESEGEVPTSPEEIVMTGKNLTPIAEEYEISQQTISPPASPYVHDIFKEQPSQRPVSIQKNQFKRVGHSGFSLPRALPVLLYHQLSVQADDAEQNQPSSSQNRGLSEELGTQTLNLTEASEDLQPIEQTAVIYEKPTIAAIHQTELVSVGQQEIDSQTHMQAIFEEIQQPEENTLLTCSAAVLRLSQREELATNQTDVQHEFDQIDSQGVPLSALSQAPTVFSPPVTDFSLKTNIPHKTTESEVSQWEETSMVEMTHLTRQRSEAEIIEEIEPFESKVGLDIVNEEGLGSSGETSLASTPEEVEDDLRSEEKIPPVRPPPPARQQTLTPEGYEEKVEWKYPLDEEAMAKLEERCIDTYLGTQTALAKVGHEGEQVEMVEETIEPISAVLENGPQIYKEIFEKQAYIETPTAMAPEQSLESEKWDNSESGETSFADSLREDDETIEMEATEENEFAESNQTKLDVSPQENLDQPKIEVPELTQEELDHIEMIKRLAEEDEILSKTVFYMQPTSAEVIMEPKSAESVISAQTAELSQNEIVPDIQLDHIAKMDTQSPQIIIAPTDHIISNAVVIDDAKELRKPELTQEELDHIEKIRKLAEEDDFYYHISQQTVPIAKAEIKYQVEDNFMPALGETDIENKIIENEDESERTSSCSEKTSLADSAHEEEKSFETESDSIPKTIPRSSINETEDKHEPQLSQAELEHIETIRQLAQQEGFLSGVIDAELRAHTAYEETKPDEELEKSVSERTSQQFENDKFTTTVEKEGHVGLIWESRLNEEEMAHIEAVKKMATDDAGGTKALKLIPIIKETNFNERIRKLSEERSIEINVEEIQDEIQAREDSASPLTSSADSSIEEASVESEDMETKTDIVDIEKVQEMIKITPVRPPPPTRQLTLPQPQRESNISAKFDTERSQIQEKEIMGIEIKEERDFEWKFPLGESAVQKLAEKWIENQLIEPKAIEEDEMLEEEILQEEDAPALTEEEQSAADSVTETRTEFVKMVPVRPPPPVRQPTLTAKTSIEIIEATLLPKQYDTEEIGAAEENIDEKDHSSVEWKYPLSEDAVRRLEEKWIDEGQHAIAQEGYGEEIVEEEELVPLVETKTQIHHTDGEEISQKIVENFTEPNDEMSQIAQDDESMLTYPKDTETEDYQHAENVAWKFPMDEESMRKLEEKWIEEGQHAVGQEQSTLEITEEAPLLFEEDSVEPLVEVYPAEVHMSIDNSEDYSQNQEESTIRAQEMGGETETTPIYNEEVDIDEEREHERVAWQFPMDEESMRKLEEKWIEEGQHAVGQEQGTVEITEEAPILFEEIEEIKPERIGMRDIVTCSEPIIASDENALTAEEMAHIERIRQLAEQSSFERLKTNAEVGKISAQEIIVTEKEPVIMPKDGMRSFSKSTETSGADSIESDIREDKNEEKELILEYNTKPKEIVIDAKSEVQLTDEELAHIEQIAKLADEQGFMGTVDAQISSMHEDDRSVAKMGYFGRTSDAEISRAQPESAISLRTVDKFSGETTKDEDVENIYTTHPDLTQEEWEHIQTVTLLAQEENLNATMRQTKLNASQIKDNDTDISKPTELTAEELAHIERIRRLAEESSFEAAVFQKIDQETLDETDLVAFKSAMESELNQPIITKTEFEEDTQGSTQELEESSDKTSLADQISNSSFEEGSAVNYSRSSPLLAEDDLVPHDLQEPELIPSQVDNAPVELTREELEHIEMIQKLAEQSSFEAKYSPTMQKATLMTKAMAESPIDEEKYYIKEDELEDEEKIASMQSSSSKTSMADSVAQELSSSMEYTDEHMVPEAFYGKSSPLLSENEEDIVEEEKIPEQRGESGRLTQEELEHIERIRRLAEECSFDANFNAKTVANEDIDDMQSDFHIESVNEMRYVDEPESRKEPGEVIEVESAICFEGSGESSSFEETKGEDAFSSAVYDRSSPLISDREEPEADEFAMKSEVDSGGEFKQMIEIYRRDEEIQEINVTIPATSPLAQTFAETEAPPANKPRQMSLTMTTISYTHNVSINQQLHPLRPWSSVCDDQRMDSQASGQDDNLLSASRTSSPLKTRSKSNVRVLFTDEKLRASFSRSSFNDEGELKEDELLIAEIKEPPVVPKINAYEECERRTLDEVAQSPSVDFIAKLNFYAQRLSEEIAESAAVDIGAIYRLRSNPRARYFDDEYADLYGEDQQSTTSEESEQVEEKVEERPYQIDVIQEEPDKLGVNLFTSFFRRRSSADRPRSALSFLQQSARPASAMLRQDSQDTSNRKWSDQTRGTGDIMDLIRRASGTAETNQESIPVSESINKLPSQALRGLSIEEREHVMKVLNASNIRPKSSQESAPQSRRSSSAMYSLPEMQDLEDSERRHIAEVIQKASQKDAPFVISRMSSETSRRNSPIRRLQSVDRPAADSSDTDRSRTESPAMRHMIRVESNVEISTEQKNSDALLDENEITNEELDYIRQVNDRAEEQLMSLKRVTQPDEYKTEKKQQGSMFGGIFSMKSALSKAKVVAEKVNASASSFGNALGANIIEDARSDEIVTQKLSEELLEPFGVAEAQEITEREDTVISKPYTPEYVRDEAEEPPEPASHSQDVSLSSSSSEPEKFDQTYEQEEFSQEPYMENVDTLQFNTEIRHSEDIDHTPLSAMLYSTRDEKDSESVGQKQLKNLSNIIELSQDELDQIEKVRRMAETQGLDFSVYEINQGRLTKFEQPENALSAEELEHIRRINEMADAEFRISIPDEKPIYEPDEPQHFALGHETKMQQNITEPRSEQIDHSKEELELKMKEKTKSFGFGLKKKFALPSSIQSVMKTTVKEFGSKVEELKHELSSDQVQLRELQYKSEIKESKVQTAYSTDTDSGVSESALSEAEIEHIRKVAERANAELQLSAAYSPTTAEFWGAEPQTLDDRRPSVELFILGASDNESRKEGSMDSGTESLALSAEDGQVEDRECVDESARQVAEEISWFQEELQRMNKSIHEENWMQMGEQYIQPAEKTTQSKHPTESSASLPSPIVSSFYEEERRKIEESALSFPFDPSTSLMDDKRSDFDSAPTLTYLSEEKSREIQIFAEEQQYSKENDSSIDSSARAGQEGHDWSIHKILESEIARETQTWTEDMNPGFAAENRDTFAEDMTLGPEEMGGRRESIRNDVHDTHTELAKSPAEEATCQPLSPSHAPFSSLAHGSLPHQLATPPQTAPQNSAPTATAAVVPITAHAVDVIGPEPPALNQTTPTTSIPNRTYSPELLDSEKKLIEPIEVKKTRDDFVDSSERRYSSETEGGSEPGEDDRLSSATSEGGSPQEEEDYEDGLQDREPIPVEARTTIRTELPEISNPSLDVEHHSERIPTPYVSVESGINQKNLEESAQHTAPFTFTGGGLKGMFGGGKGKAGGFGGFASKFAADALKGARQAGEKAAAATKVAAEKAAAATAPSSAAGSTSSLPQAIGTTAQQLQTPSMPSRPQSAMAGIFGRPDVDFMPTSSLSGSLSQLPPGLEDLSEEERRKIMDVMQCAERDGIMAADSLTPGPISDAQRKISGSRTMESIGAQLPNTAPNLTTTKAISSASLSPPASQNLKTASPSAEDICMGLSELSAEEQEKILAVMRMAEQQEQMSAMPSVAPKQTKITEAVIIHEQLNDKDGTKTRKLSFESRQEQIPSQSLSSVVPPINEKDEPNVGTKSADLYYYEEVGPGKDEEVDVDEEQETVQQILRQRSYSEVDEDQGPDLSLYGQPSVDYSSIDVLSSPKEPSMEYGILPPTEPETKDRPESQHEQHFAQITSEIGEDEDDADVWMQPQHEYKPPENWDAIRGPITRMWTTDFSDNELEAQPTDLLCTAPNVESKPPQEEKRKSVAPLEDISVETVRGCWELEHNQPLQFHKPGGSREITSDRALDGSASKISDEVLAKVYHDQNNHYEIEMEDPLSPKFISSVQNSAEAHAIFDVEKPRAPEIVLSTVSGEKKAPSADEDSDGATPPSSDEEEDYPDQVIQAPSAPMSYAAMQEERDAQSAFAKEVFQQIQAFGEAADDEFDVQWATLPKPKKIAEQEKTITDIQSQPAKDVFEAANTYSPDSQPPPASLISSRPTQQPPSIPNAETVQKTEASKEKPSEKDMAKAVALAAQRQNPFLAPEDLGQEHDEFEDDGIVVQQVGLDEKDFSAEAEQYYKNTYYIHRPGPVYTIPEGEEEDTVVNTEGIYHAREFERRPLHGTTVPPLIPDNITPKRAQRRAAGKPTLENGIWQPPSSESVNSAYNLITGQMSTGSDQRAVPMSTTVSSTLTPIRTAPPPPPEGTLETVSAQCASLPATSAPSYTRQIVSMPPSYATHMLQHQHQQMQSGHRFTTDIAQPDDLLPVTNYQIGHWDLTDQPPQEKTPTLGNQLASASHAVKASADGNTEDFDADGSLSSPRLKRSPAMILTPSGEKPSPLIISTTSSAQQPNFTIDQSSTRAETAFSAYDTQRTTTEDVHLAPSTTTTASAVSVTTTTSTVSNIITSSAQETAMGRRKLPSLPPPSASLPSASLTQLPPYMYQHSTSATDSSIPATYGSTSAQTIPQVTQYYSGTLPSSTSLATGTAPIYYTSCAPEYRDAAVNGGSILQNGILPAQTVPKAHILFDPSSSAASTLSTGRTIQRIREDNQRRPTPAPLGQRPKSASAGANLLGSYATPSSAAKTFAGQSKTSLQPVPSLFTSPSQTHHPADPAIIPGAPFKSSVSATDAIQLQSRIFSPKPKFTSISSQNAGSQNRASSETLAQLRFKKELREILAQRRKSQEAVEIEANHREYMVSRLLNTGLMPTSDPREKRLPLLSAELDAIPRVVKCQLPAEIVNGAKIVPKGKRLEKSEDRFRDQNDPMLWHSQRGPHSEMDYGSRSQTWHSQKPMTDTYVDQSLEKKYNKRSVGCQCESQISDKSREDFEKRYYYGFSHPSTSIGYISSRVQPAQKQLPSTSLRLQLKADQQYSDSKRMVNSETQTLKTAETQTWSGASQSYAGQRSSYPPPFGKPQIIPASVYGQTLAPTQTQSSTRAKEKALAREKRRLHLTDSYNLDDIERKRREVQQELDWRKHRLNSMIELRYLDEEPDLHGFGDLPGARSDYSSATVPHYGSLPRIDYPVLETRRSIGADLSARGQLGQIPSWERYGSLPRNYERFLGHRSTEDGMRAFEEFDRRANQGYGPRSGWPSQRYPPDQQYNPSSRSLHSINTGYDYDTLRQPWRRTPSQYPAAARSMNYLDHMSPSREWNQSWDDSDVRMRQAIGLGAQNVQPSSAAPDLVSQYANYLNNQFLMSQQQRFEDEQAMAGLGPGSMRQPPPVLPREVQEDFVTPSQPIGGSVGGSTRLSIWEDPARRLAEEQVNFESQLRLAEDQRQRQILNELPLPGSGFEVSASLPQFGGGGSEAIFSPPVYSRHETNYGSRPINAAPYLGEYGNYWRNRAQSLRQLDMLNHNYVAGLQPYGYPGSQRPLQMEYPSQPPSWTMPKTPAPGSVWSYPQENGPSGYGRHNGMWRSQEDGLSRILHQYSRNTMAGQFPALPTPHSGYPRNYGGYDGQAMNYAQSNRTSQEYMDSKRQTANLERRSQQPLRFEEQQTENIRSHHSMNNVHQPSDVRRPRTKSGGEIKRILLTRKYKHENVFKDLGIRVTGGKRLRNGDLGAFITAINRNKALETLGQLQEGDQVLEWNGVLLRGKTFEEVERIITASTGEIEIIVKSHNRTKGSNSTSDMEDGVALYDAVIRESSSANLNASQRVLKSAKLNVNSLKEAPPIPAHRPNCSSQTQYSRSDDSPESNREPDPSPMRNSNTNAANAAMTLNYHRMNGGRMGGDNGGHLQVILSYDHFNAILMVRVVSARGLRCREYNNSTIVLPNPFVKIYLLPGRKVANKRRTKYIPSSADPEWNQSVDYLINSEDLPNHYLELTVWDYDKYNDNICLGQIVIRFSDPSLTYNVPRWYPLEQMSTNAIQTGMDDQTNYASSGDGRRLQIGQRRQNQSSLPNRTNGVYHDQQLYNDYPANLDAIGYPAIA